MKLSLIVAYRRRENHLKTQIAWWKTQSVNPIFSICEVIIIEMDESPSAWIQQEIENTNIQYVYLPITGVFHKTKALNCGLAIAQGQFVSPFDVDLIPVKNTIMQHLQMAEVSSQFLITGYRVMSNTLSLHFEDIPTVLEQSTTAPEDMPTALWKQLINQERFGVAPFFEKSRLIEIGGWDEAFVGWGGEDQDIIERYLQAGGYLCRSSELIYLHLSHELNKQWTEPSLIEQNRNYYYAKMQARRYEN